MRDGLSWVCQQALAFVISDGLADLLLLHSLFQCSHQCNDLCRAQCMCNTAQCLYSVHVLLCQTLSLVAAAIWCASNNTAISTEQSHTFLQLDMYQARYVPLKCVTLLADPGDKCRSVNDGPSSGSCQPFF